MIVERMRAPEAGWAAPPSLAPAFRGGAGRLDSRRSGQTAGFHALARRGSARGLLFWGGAGGPSRLRGQRAGVDDEQPACCHSASSVSVCHCPRVDATGPRPAPWGVLPGPSRLSEQQRPLALVLPPCLQCLPHGPCARDHREQP